MARYVFVGHSSALEGRDAEYNDWYLKRHLPALLQCPGVLSVRRFRLADAQLPKTETNFKYLAIYEIETEAPQDFVKEVLSRAISGQLPSGCAATAPGSSAVLWEQEELK